MPESSIKKRMCSMPKTGSVSNNKNLGDGHSNSTLLTFLATPGFKETIFLKIIEYLPVEDCVNLMSCNKELFSGLTALKIEQPKAFERLFSIQRLLHVKKLKEALSLAYRGTLNVGNSSRSIFFLRYHDSSTIQNYKATLDMLTMSTTMPNTILVLLALQSLSDKYPTFINWANRYLTNKGIIKFFIATDEDSLPMRDRLKKLFWHSYEEMTLKNDEVTTASNRLIELLSYLIDHAENYLYESHSHRDDLFDALKTLLSTPVVYQDRFCIFAEFTSVEFNKFINLRFARQSGNERLWGELFKVLDEMLNEFNNGDDNTYKKLLFNSEEADCIVKLLADADISLSDKISKKQSLNSSWVDAMERLDTCIQLRKAEIVRAETERQERAAEVLVHMMR